MRRLFACLAVASALICIALTARANSAAAVPETKRPSSMATRSTGRWTRRRWTPRWP